MSGWFSQAANAPTLLKVLLAACVLLQALCFLISAISGYREWYLCAFVLFSSCACLGVYFWQKRVEDAMAAAFLFGCFFGIAYPCLCAIVYGKNAREKRRARQRDEVEKAAYVLPEKHNDFLRDRLQNNLCKKEEDRVDRAKAFQLVYVRRAIEKLRACALSPADRLEVESISEKIQQKDEQREFSASQLRALNDLFARVLKLSAKYSL